MWEALKVSTLASRVSVSLAPSPQAITTVCVSCVPGSVKLPETVVLEITEADPHIKGQTAASSYKSATLENGLRVQVPPFIEAGEKIIVSTDDVSYVRRAE